MPYRFKKEYRDAVISIPQLRLNITRFNIHDEDVQKVLKKMPGRYDHNFEWFEEGVSEEVLKAQDEMVETMENIEKVVEKSTTEEKPSEPAPQTKLVEKMVPHQPGKLESAKPKPQGKSNKSGKNKKSKS